MHNIGKECDYEPYWLANIIQRELGITDKGFCSGWLFTVMPKVLENAASMVFRKTEAGTDDRGNLIRRTWFLLQICWRF
jgi:hypothetical protein